MEDKEKYILDEWNEKIEDFKASVDKELDEMHKCKNEVAKIKEDIYNHVFSGYYMRDDNCIVISAPEVIIGNVDKSGTIKGPSKVTIRSNDVNLEGVGKGGAIKARANTISNVCEDPGIDGREAVVYNSTSFTCQANNIIIDSTKSMNTYAHEPKSIASGLSLHSDTNISIDASVENKTLEDSINAQISALDTSIEKYNEDISKSNESLEASMSAIKDTLNTQKGLWGSEDLCNANVAAIDTLSVLVTKSSMKLFKQIDKHLALLSNLAEAKRKKSALKSMTVKSEKNNIIIKDEKYKESSGANISLNAEAITLTTKNGEHEICEGEKSGVNLTGVKNIHIDGKNGDGTLIEDSNLQVESQHINLFTNQSKKEEEKKPYHLDKADGEVRINSKSIIVSANDYEAPKEKGEGEKPSSDDLYPVSAVAEGSTILIGANSIEVTSADKDGKADGKISINSKDLTIQSANVEKKKEGEEGNDDGKVNLAEGGIAKIFAETINIGGDDKDTCLAKTAMVKAEQEKLIGEKDILVQQGKEDKNSIAIDENGNINVKSENSQLFDSKKHELKGEVNISNSANIEKSKIKDLTVSTKIEAPGGFKGSN